MSWDASRDQNSGRARRTEEPKLRGSRRPNSSSRPPAGIVSQSPRRSVRTRDRSLAPAQTQALPAVIEEELWFGGHDPTVAEDTAARSMAALVGRIVGAKPFPESARRLAELTRKDVIRIEPIIHVLERDPALSARLLRLVNSAGYALRQRCTSVRHAATLVGTDRLHQIATTAAVLDLFDSRGSIAASVIEHSTIVGAFCRYFGAHLALPVDDLFTAGFLHDIGKLMLLETEGDQYVQLLEQYADQPDMIHVAERSLYGFDHAVLAAHVLTAWNIPDPVPKIVAWHHEPTRAYRVSSMMAALVQTVRLADATVCALVRGVSPEEFSNLATTESASYLDISEPQLASMWEELQNLYRESVEQCRGENAPALDPRSLKPKQPLSVAAQDPTRATELPLQFPCVVCGGPTFGNTCNACGGHMCPEHQVGREDWCTLCSRDYHSEESESPPFSPKLALVVGGATFFISVAFGYETGGTAGSIRAGIGTFLLLVLAALLAVIGRRWLLRFRFVRSRPDRKIVDALENDGGVKSLVPPTMNDGNVSIENSRDPLSEHIRLSGGMVERVMIDDVPSIPAIIAPRPFDGLKGSSLFSRPPQQELPPPDMNDAPPSSRRTFDAERVMMQGLSLVTLPAPAQSQGAAPRAPDFSGNMSDAADSNDTESATVQISDPISTRQEPTDPTRHERIEPSPIEIPKEASFEIPGPAPTDGQQEATGRPNQLVPHDARVEAPAVSLHPLAALGLNPPGTSKRPTIRDLRSGPSEEAEAAELAASEADPEERTTLLGLTSNGTAAREPEPFPATPERPPAGESALMGLTAEVDSELLAIQQPDDSPVGLPSDSATQPPHSTAPLDETGATSEPAPLPAHATGDSVEFQAASPAPVTPPTEFEPQMPAEAGPPAEEVIPLATFLKSEPPPKQQPNPEELIQPLAAALGPEILGKLGQDFQDKVMELVAQRVAAAVAEQMLQSFGHSTHPLQRSKPARVPVPRSGDSDLPDTKLPAKRSRKRIAKH